MEFTVTQMDKNIWAIDQQGVRSFLLVGEDGAILIDTCFGGDLASVCRELCGDKPVTLLTTHADPDHIGGDGQFPAQYLHLADFLRYEAVSKHSAHAKPLAEGNTFTAGEFTLEVVYIPGHTPGSVAFLDRKHKFLIAGDTVQNGSVFMFGEGRDLRAYLESVKKLEDLRQEGAFDTVYASHGVSRISADILPDLIALAQELLAGKGTPVGPAPDRFPPSVKTYRHGRAQMFFEQVM